LSAQPETDLEKLFATIRERKGACRHSSEAFMVLAQLIDVPARINVNENQVPDHHFRWHKIDLGGSPVVDKTPDHLRNNPLDNLAISSPQEDMPEPDVMDVKQSTVFKNYYSEFKKRAEFPDISLADLFQPHAHNVLLKLSVNQTPFSVNQMITQYLKSINQQQDYCYIDNPKDFSLYFSARRLVDNRMIKVEDGPLVALIKTGGTILVNWDKFSENEMMNYKSILDDKPRLFGRPVTKQLKVISLSTSQTNSSIFATRTKAYHLSSPSLPMAPMLFDHHQAKITVSVSASHNWREKLYGKFVYQGNEKIIYPGPLHQAILSGQSIVIENPPVNDSAYDLMVHRALVERKFFFNGKFITVPEQFDIIHTYAPMTTLQPSNVIIEYEPVTNKSFYPQPIYIAMHNLHECIEILKIEGGQATTIQGGLCSTYDPGKHVFYITGDITQLGWHQLAGTMKAYPNKQFTVLLAQGVKLGSAIENESKPDNVLEEVEEKSSLYFHAISNDMDFSSQSLAQRLTDAGAVPLVIDVNPQTTFLDLVARIQFDSAAGFTVINKQLLLAIQNGQTVILNGDLSPTLYQQLLPLLSRPGYLSVNGTRFEPAHQTFPALLCVMPESTSNALSLIDVVNKQVNFDDYAMELLSRYPKAQTSLSRLKEFYQHAERLVHRGSDRPNKLQRSFHLLTRMIEKLESPSSLHEHNPIKGLLHYDYPKQSDDYAYLNVMAKYSLRPEDAAPINYNKFERLSFSCDMQNREQVRSHVWKLLNCFKGAELRQVLGNDLTHSLEFNNGFPALTDAALENLFNHIKHYTNNNAAVLVKDGFLKQRQQIKALYEDKVTKLIFLKGLPGVGKTNAVRNVIGDWYESDDEFILWLQKADKPFLIDEANMQAPGALDYLKAIARGDAVYYYKGQHYPMTDQHKIILTGNPEYFANRHYHSILQHYAETIYFSKPDDDLLTKIIQQDLVLDLAADKSISKRILFVYHLIEKTRPNFEISIRDIKNMVARFNVLSSKVSDINLALLQACTGEFSGLFKELNQRHQFINQLEKQFGVKQAPTSPVELIQVTPYLTIPSEKQYLLDSLQQDLLMRKTALAKREPFNFKTCTLIEGDSGLGKSTLLEAILLNNGITTDGVGNQKLYILSAGTDEESRELVYETLNKAFHEGAFVMIDEIDLDDQLEVYLNQYLSGVDKRGDRPAQPGFMVFASKNASTLAGHKSVSPALLNRSHFMYMDDFSEVEVKKIAESKLIPNADVFASAYQAAAKDFSGVVNARTLYQMTAQAEARVFAALSSAVNFHLISYITFDDSRQTAVLTLTELVEQFKKQPLPNRNAILMGCLYTQLRKADSEHRSQWFHKKSSRLVVRLQKIIQEYVDQFKLSNPTAVLPTADLCIQQYEAHINYTKCLSNKI
jgi:hypothetical protein